MTTLTPDFMKMPASTMRTILVEVTELATEWATDNNLSTGGSSHSATTRAHGKQLLAALGVDEDVLEELETVRLLRNKLEQISHGKEIYDSQVLEVMKIARRE